MEFTGARVSDLPTVEVSVWVDASPQRVWSVVSDITAMPEVSGELQSVELLDTGPLQVGSRFRGHNYHEMRGAWSTVSHVVQCEEPRVFSWAVDDVERPNSTWRFTLRPDDGGTALTYSVQLGPGPSGLNRFIDRMPEREPEIVFHRLTEFERNMNSTLAALKARAEDAHPAAD
ncbi:SRPBCC family protein [Marinitenerispora sediminis]|uniref:Cyclase n=1 Tax=Marinitenerispora sediminis TaxID=1931232 RepID=A0A368T2C1_9ACTN|nr:SRPBCC family protein [Marinitenerispora sediminis]RCV48786.1 cyclase [Marinitenerispora sediminis]RCV50718.1 cyclase [Marinitenerispora sediminis]RCV55624.1 cyclase [Marinitenerispora sediminis]